MPLAWRRQMSKIRNKKNRILIWKIISSLVIKPLKPRNIEDSEGESDEDVFPGPICISCAGVDNDPLVWCSGCGDPYHLDCAQGHPKTDAPYRWLCMDCRQTCVSCHDAISLGAQIFKCKTCWRVIHRRCVDPTVRADYKATGWPCFHCQRYQFPEPPITPCHQCSNMPIKNCPPKFSCKRCQSSISSCCLDLSSSVLQYKGELF